MKFIQAVSKLFDLIQSFVTASFKIKHIFEITIKYLIPYLAVTKTMLVNTWDLKNTKCDLYIRHLQITRPPYNVNKFCWLKYWVDLMWFISNIIQLNNIHEKRGKKHEWLLDIQYFGTAVKSMFWSQWLKGQPCF